MPGTVTARAPVTVLTALRTLSGPDISPLAHSILAHVPFLRPWTGANPADTLRTPYQYFFILDGVLTTQSSDNGSWEKEPP